MPPEEIVTTVLPQFNGVLDHYWGRNVFKLHTEYLGPIVLVLAVLGLGDRGRRRTVQALGVIGVLFLLVAFGGHTPFYYLWYEVMPMMKKVRAPGMAFFLVALPVAVFAAFGTDRLLRREVSFRTLATALGVLAGVALLGVVGVLQAVATVLAGPEQASRVVANASALQLGALRLLLVVVIGGGVLWAVWRGRIAGAGATAALAVIVIGDLWSIDRLFFEFRDPAAVTFRDDAVTSRLRAEPKPFRVLDVGVYQGSYLMAHNIQSMLGYHGQELRFYDELLGGKGQWRYAGSPSLLDLLGVRFLLLPESQPVPGFHQVLGPVETTPGPQAVLFQRDTVPAYARVVAGAAKLAEDQIPPTVIDPRFPYSRLALFSDTASVTPEKIRPGQIPDAPQIAAAVSQWTPGRMRVTLSGSASTPTYLLVGENWYPDWHATVDGKPAPVLRGDYTMLSVALPPGAREVRLWFASATYPRGKVVTAVALLATLALLATPLWTRRRSSANA
jgi:hypothetical protein